MSTKVKPCRIKATGTPQVGYVPKYVDEDTFQWGAGGGGGGSDIVYVTQAEYNALLPGAESDNKHYFIYSTSGSRLPSTYQEVEYIESSGTQYLAPGVAHEAGDTIKVEADIYVIESNDGAIYSQYTSASPLNMRQLGIDYGVFFARVNSSENGTLHTTWTPSTFTENTRYNVVAEGQTSINQKAPYLLANNNANGVSWYMSAKLYSFKIRKNGTLVRDLVPCYRKLDSVIGTYDIVNDVFYTNSGTGTFTKGSDV